MSRPLHESIETRLSWASKQISTNHIWRENGRLLSQCDSSILILGNSIYPFSGATTSLLNRWSPCSTNTNRLRLCTSYPTSKQENTALHDTWTLYFHLYLLHVDDLVLQSMFWALLHHWWRFLFINRQGMKIKAAKTMTNYVWGIKTFQRFCQNQKGH